MDLLGELVGFAAEENSIEPESGIETPGKASDDTEDIGPQTEGLAIL